MSAGKRAAALGLAAGLVGWSLVVPRFPSRWNPVPQAVVGTTLALLSGASLGLRPPQLWSGLRLGVATAVSVSAGVAAATALPRARTELSGRDVPDGVLRWLLVGIPLGTVWSEEAAFRGTLGTVAADAFGPSRGRLLQSAAFGLSHIADARSTGMPALSTVLVTGAAGWLFGWLHDRTGSLLAPMLAHLAINEAGAVAALSVQRSARARRARADANTPKNR
ncbi:Rv0804 family intramembrane glutamic endopeptidase [Mycolicibacterium elephantis]|uniref:Rv0804 family intramembrane glutamic endopeptidase n=1 Tax=Mycolicibacterium elephantis TaxID=81858 RepID=UPI0007E9AE57|nr:CPBP family intramembrane glutamic endopeptidase [Mycolicibacterium elephantis]OBE96459.1 abortive phage infection protein [Mycolicibacterium elephantis]